MAQLRLQIITPERIVYEDVVDSLTVHTENGEVTILPKHAPLVTLLRAGEMTLRDGKGTTHLAVSTGMLEVRNGDSIVVLADTAERSDELDMKAIEEAKKLAHQRLEEARNENEVAYADALVHLERELARHKVASKKYRDVGKHMGS